MHYATVTVNHLLEIELSTNEGKSVAVRLSRIAAQHVVSALSEYAGAATKSFGRERTTTVAAIDLTEQPIEPPHRVLRLSGGGTKRRIKL